MQRVIIASSLLASLFLTPVAAAVLRSRPKRRTFIAPGTPLIFPLLAIATLRQDDGHEHDAEIIAPDVLWLARPRRRLRLCRLLLGDLLLRRLGLSPHASRDARLAGGRDLGGDHRALPAERGDGRLSRRRLSSPWRRPRDTGRRPGARRRHARLGLGRGAVAALCRGGTYRAGLVDDEQRRDQRHAGPVVQPAARLRPQPRLQRRASAA